MPSPRLLPAGLLIIGLATLSPDAHAAGGARRALRGAAVTGTALAALATTAGPANAIPAPDPFVGSTTSQATAQTLAPPGRAFRNKVRNEAPIAPGADPSILTIDHGPNAGYYLVTTGNRSIRYSDDLVHWQKAGNLFRGGKLPRGAVSDFWAPSLEVQGDRFFLRYSARGTNGILRVRSAVADQVTGPYRDLGPTVPLRPGSRVGSIDADQFVDVDGSSWLLWKSEGNPHGLPTPLMIQRLGEGGMKLEGKPHQMATNDRAWEGPIIEAPNAFRRGDFVYVSYAGHLYGRSTYNVGMLRIHAPDGLRAAIRNGATWQKHDGPVADSISSRHVGMAHGDFILDGDFFASHGWKAGRVMVDPRETIVRRVLWTHGWPQIHNSGKVD